MRRHKRYCRSRANTQKSFSDVHSCINTNAQCSMIFVVVVGVFVVCTTIHKRTGSKRCIEAKPTLPSHTHIHKHITLNPNLPIHSHCVCFVSFFLTPNKHTKKKKKNLHGDRRQRRRKKRKITRNETFQNASPFVHACSAHNHTKINGWRTYLCLFLHSITSASAVRRAI